jgi:hypothetical protein
MIYNYTETNIVSLLQSVGTLEEGQLVRFFSSELQPIRVKYLLNELVLNRVITFDKDHCTYSAVGTPSVIDEIVERRILAFWAVANMGSNGVYEILTTRYPTQFLVIAPDATTYDFTVIESDLEARVAARVLAESLMRGVEDDINHVAVLRRPSEVERLRSVLIETGFDCCCTIDYQTKAVSYVTFDTI